MKPVIIGDIKVGGKLKVIHEGGIEFQWYRNGELIPGEENEEYTLKITDWGCEITCAVAYGETDIELADSIYIDFFEQQSKPPQKEYLLKLYDKDMHFIKMIPESELTNTVSFSENINGGQGELSLNIAFPINTNFFEGIKYIKVFESDIEHLDNRLIYTGYISKLVRSYNNNKENIKVSFLGLYSLLSSLYLKDSGETHFFRQGECSVFLKKIIDYVNQFYPVFHYTADSIVPTTQQLDLEIDGELCSDLVSKVLGTVDYYLYVDCNGLVSYKPRTNTYDHYFTYEKDITALTIPEDDEGIINAVRVEYGYLGGSHKGITERALDQESINLYGRKEITIKNTSIYGEENANAYRDTYLSRNKHGKKTITITINDTYDLETIHPGQTMKIRNLGLNLDTEGLQIQSVSYEYDNVKIQLGVCTTIATEIFGN